MDRVTELDEGGRWADLQSKDLPMEITNYVAEALTERSVDEVRRSLGMKNPTDPRWKKIMTALRTGARVDSVGLFLQWMNRTNRMGEKLEKICTEILDGHRPMSNALFSGLNTLSAMQSNVVKMGKELGVFTDGTGGNQGGQGVTIVVQTNVPHPSREAIVVHQEGLKERGQQLLEKHRPGEK